MWRRAALGMAATLAAAAAALPGVSAAPQGTGAGPPPLLEFGDSGAAVTTLQQDLLTLGYRPAGAADGTFGGQSWVELVFFQRDQGMLPTGNADPATWAALQRALAAGGTPVASGATGTAVSGLQARLLSLGYAAGPVNGVFGPETLAALTAFQFGQLLPPTGFLDPATSAALAAAAPAPAPTPSASATAGGGPAVLAYWAVWGTDTAPMASLQQHGSAITWLSPYWYTLEGDGTLRSRETDHAAVLAAAAAAHDRVLALINDGSGVQGLLATGSGRGAAVAGVSGMLAANPGIAGVMVDFESLPASSGSDLTAFVAALRAALPAADTVGVAVGAEVSANEPGEGFYQYAALGAAADLVQVMTYDDHDNTTGPGPVAPTAWVSRVAQFAASVIPPDKILLGVPAYGYDWSSAGGATSVTVEQALALAQRYGVTPHLDAASGEDTFTYTDGSGAMHTVWFEAAAGVAAKRALAVRLGLRGLAVWTIGGESPDFWPALTGH